MVPSYGKKLVDDPALYRQIRGQADHALGLA